MAMSKRDSGKSGNIENDSHFVISERLLYLFSCSAETKEKECCNTDCRDGVPPKFFNNLERQKEKIKPNASEFTYTARSTYFSMMTSTLKMTY